MTRQSSHAVALDADYREWIRALGVRIRAAQVKAAVRVNSELLRLYWALGAELAEKSKTATWGEGWLEATSRDLLSEFPEMKGFSFRNLNSMRQWYAFYSAAILKQPVSKSGDEAPEIEKQPVSQLGEAFFSVPWGHHLYILQRCKASRNTSFRDSTRRRSRGRFRRSRKSKATSWKVTGSRTAMKKNLGAKNWMFPMPVLMVGTYGEDGTPDVMNAPQSFSCGKELM